MAQKLKKYHGLSRGSLVLEGTEEEDPAKALQGGMAELAGEEELAAASPLTAAHTFQERVSGEASPVPPTCQETEVSEAILADKPMGSFWLLVGLLCVLSVGLWEALKLVRWVWCRVLLWVVVKPPLETKQERRESCEAALRTFAPL